MQFIAFARAKNQAKRSRPKGGVGSNALDRRSVSGDYQGREETTAQQPTIGRTAVRPSKRQRAVRPISCNEGQFRGRPLLIRLTVFLPVHSA